MRKPGTNTANTENLALSLVERYNNCGLFADNYLKSRMNDLADWRKTPGLDEAFEAIKKLYGETREALAYSNEAQTEADFIRPILDLLWADDGKCWDVQVLIPALGERGKQPDYAFFRTAAQRNSAGQHKGTQDYWRDVPCLGDAKGWNISLDKDRARGENPSAQMSDYLYRSRVRWGILTNGRLWRLYEQDKSRAGGVFFEVDLQVALEHNDRDTFQWFYSFFRRAAFVPDAEGKTFVDSVFQGSVDYATDVGDRLKDSVYDALSALMNGFLDRASNRLDRHDEVTLRTVHDNTLILLYRLLFILYAEDRGLLPLKNGHYQTYALLYKHREVNDKLGAGKSYLGQTTGIWSYLLNLFCLIDEPDPASGIPAFNGGLFSPARHPHIAHTPQPDCLRWEIGDDALAQAIDMLAYKRDRWEVPGTQDVDYKSLDVQHLGSIYEGLLELQPEVAKVPLVEVSEKGKIGFEPEAKVKKPGSVRGQTPRRVPKDAVYLVTNRGERKATGSYYTPKYIVDYIIENTVGPLAEEAAEKVAELRGAVDKRTAELEKTIREWEKRDPKDESGELHIKKLRQEADKERRKLLEPYLSLAILDPAMGSGHFLVGAADFLSLAMATDPNLLPLEAMGTEDEQAYYKRLVIEHCLYGVDLNPLAVELAKLSLWLHTVSKNKALSFLDHHLRCGNSLIGATIEDMGKPPPLFDKRGRIVASEAEYIPIAEAVTQTHVQSFLDIFKEISECTGGTVEIERHKAKIYEEMDEVRDRFRAVANCWIAPYFGQPVLPKQYERAVNALKAPTQWEKLEAESWFRHAQQIAAGKRLFHWQLEFPERFFSRDGLKTENDQGFDAVVGNPPWGAELSSSDQAMYSQRYETGKASSPESYALMTEQALRQLRTDGFFGFITPDTGLRKDDLVGWRELILTQSRLNQLVETGPLFHDVPDTWCLITLCAKTTAPPTNSKVMHRQISRFVVSADERLLLFSASAYSRESYVDQSYWLSRPSKLIGYLASSEEQGIIAHMEAMSTELGGMVKQFAVSRGEEGSKFRVQSLPSSDFHMVLPEHVERYSVERGIPISSESVTRSKLSGYYSHPKIWVVRIQKLRWRQRLVAGLDGRQDSAAMKTLQVIVSACDDCANLRYLNAIIASRLMNVWCTNYLVDDMNQTYLERIPVRRIDASTPAPDRKSLSEEFAGMYREGTSANLMAVFAQSQLSAQPERADVVHDILAFLAGEMIDLNKSKQEEGKGFLTWLEGYIGCAIEEFTNKTKVKEYHKFGFDSLSAVMSQNGKKLTVSPEARATIETIKPEFEKSVAKLEPLKARIAATDQLIDQIVYKLYGLTEEEIRIVEGECEPTDPD